MEPIPESVEAVEELGPFEYDDRLLEDLQELAARVREVVPECVGLSVGIREHHVTFTPVATDEEVAMLDAMQYVDGGPCVTSATENETVAFHTDDGVLQGRWPLFAGQAVTQGVGSSLTLPVVVNDRVTRTYNLYAAAAHAFDGHADDLAAVLGAYRHGAVTDADLSFSTRVRAQAAPHVLRADSAVTRATQGVATRHGTTLEAARHLIESAAARAGIHVHQLAPALTHLETR